MRAKDERRLLQRFGVKAFSYLRTAGGQGNVLALCTRDVSSGGAYFPTRLPLPAGEKVLVTLYLPLRAPAELGSFPSRAMITTDGEVVRSGIHGMAVKFEGKYSIAPAPVAPVADDPAPTVPSPEEV